MTGAEAVDRVHALTPDQQVQLVARYKKGDVTTLPLFVAYSLYLKLRENGLPLERIKSELVPVLDNLTIKIVREEKRGR